MNESLIDSIKKVNIARTLIKTKFAVDKPEKLANIEFQKRFYKARTKWNRSQSFGSNADVIKDSAMMLRAYDALEEELAREGIIALPAETWFVERKDIEQNVLICRTEEQKLNALEQHKERYVIFSAEELVNMIHIDVYNIKSKLTENGMMPKITNLKDKDAK
tara:strand:- start:973 stop:1461 length:489 start_codon:yes stop_codon:yes gene_type:complete